MILAEVNMRTCKMLSYVYNICPAAIVAEQQDIINDPDTINKFNEISAMTFEVVEKFEFPAIPKKEIQPRFKFQNVKTIKK